MTTAKSIPWVASAVAIFALGYSGFQYREARLREREASTLKREGNRLHEELRASEQRSTQFAQRASQAEKRIAELEEKRAGLPTPKPMTVMKKAPPTARAKQTLDAERMAQMKPLLESGLPIKGAVIVLVDGKPVQRQVEFVMGRETQIEGAEEGVYLVTPTLNSDGTVNYAIKLRTSAGKPEQIETLPSIVQTPWGGFTLGGGTKAMAFDPDN